MTRAEANQKLQELRASAEEKVKAYNEAFQEKKAEDYLKLDTEIADIIGEYTAIARDIVFEDCKASDNPMLTACERLSFMTIATKDTAEGDDKIPVRSIIDKERQIDLLKLHKYCDGIGADHNWLYMVERFNMLLTAQKAVDLGIDPKAVNDSYAMSEIAHSIDLGKNPTSKTKILGTLRSIITAMLGEEYANKATSHDVNFLMSVYSRKNRKALTVTCANHKYMRGYVMEICHRIITDKAYEVDYKKSNK